MPATETPEQWAEGFYSSFGDEHYSQACIRDAIAELADLKRRADQADRMREALEAIVEFWDFAAQEKMTTPIHPDALIGGHDGDEPITIQDVCRAALADNP